MEEQDLTGPIQLFLGLAVFASAVLFGKDWTDKGRRAGMLTEKASLLLLFLYLLVVFFMVSAAFLIPAFWRMRSGMP